MGSNDGKLHAIDPKTGKAKWVYATPDGAIGSPALANDGTLYFASQKRLYALNPDATEAWHYDLAFGAAFSAQPAVGGDRDRRDQQRPP